MHSSEMVRHESGLVPPQGLRLGGKFHCEIRRKGITIDTFEVPNLVTNEGLNALLDIMFHGATQITAWFVGLFEGNYTPVAGVTAATITAASTECTAYTSSTRPAYDEAAASSQAITNSASRASFVMNATKTVYGVFLVSNSTKSSTSGTLFSAARFSTAKTLDSGDELLVTYTFSAASV